MKKGKIAKIAKAEALGIIEGDDGEVVLFSNDTVIGVDITTLKKNHEVEYLASESSTSGFAEARVVTTTTDAVAALSRGRKQGTIHQTDKTFRVGLINGPGDIKVRFAEEVLETGDFDSLKKGTPVEYEDKIVAGARWATKVWA